MTVPIISVGIKSMVQH